MKSGIRTEYKGICFRSRLEAKWARFFDLLKWDWVYEPTDFQGWIPDFALVGAQKTVYVEVKPVTRIDELESLGAQFKADMSDCPDEVLLVGLQPFMSREGYDYLCLGWLRQDCREELEKEPAWEWGEAAFGWWAGSSTLGFCHSAHSFTDRISGCYDGGHFGDVGADETKILKLWGEAVNGAQWRASRKLPDGRSLPAWAARR